jgi:2-amino-4-hydroxy-6-hydroxymethyldihydropteridine diphosphokinase
MGRAWLGLGANIGAPDVQVREAVRRLQGHPEISVGTQSAMLTTKPWGKTDQPDFSNMVVAVETSLKPIALLEACLGIELAMGRVRKEVWGPRLIDIDIIAYDDIQIRSARLTLPHAFAHQRDFVLEPLREIAPEIADWVVAINTRPR